MKNLLFLILAILQLSAIAQQNLTGLIIDEDQKPMPSATVALLHPTDSTLAYFGISNPKGEFTVPRVAAGSYIVQVAYIGYQTNYINLKVPTANNGNLGAIVMKPTPINLEGVVVKAEMIPIIFKNDTVEFNAAAFKTGPDAVAEDLLKKLPGVEVDREGNIKAMGENVNKVLVDGKEFFSSDPKVATKNLPAESISKVQVYDKKSDQSELLGIDDSEYSKTINFTLKDDMKKAVFGDVKAGGDAMNYYQGNAKVYRFTEKHQVAALGMLNNVNRVGFSFRDYIDFNGGLRNIMSSGGGSITINASSGIPIDMGQPNNGNITAGAAGTNYSYEIAKNNQFNISYMANGTAKTVTDNIYSHQFSDTRSFEQTSKENGEGKNLNHLFNLGWRNKASNTQHFMVNGIATIASSDSKSNSLTQSYADGVFANQLDNATQGNSQQLSSTVNGSWLRRLNSKWLMVKTDAELRYNQNIGENSWLNSTTLASSPLPIIDNQLNNNRTSMLSASGKITALHRLGANLYLEPVVSAGYNNEYLNRQQGSVHGVFAAIDSLSPNINRDHQWIKPRLTLKSNSRKRKLNLGVELEAAQQYQTLNDTAGIEHSVLAILPQLNWQYEFKSGHRITLDYRTQTIMPTAWQLQPIISTSNPLALQFGNRDLSHEYRHTASLSWLLYDQFSFTSIFANINTSYTQNKIGQSVTVSDNFSQQIELVNVPYDYTATGSVNFSTPIRPLKVNINLNIRETWNRTISYVNGVDNVNTNNIHTFRLRVDNRAKNKWDIGAGGEVSLSSSRYSIQHQLNRKYHSYKAFSDLAYTPTKAWNFRVSADITSYDAQSFEQSITVPLLSAEVSYHFLANRRAVISVEGYDLLNRNTGLTRSSGFNYLREVQSNTIGRYLLLSFKYKLNSMGADSGGITIRTN